MTNYSINQHDLAIVAFLKRRKFLTSSEIIGHLVKKFGVTEVNGRQIVNRTATKKLIYSTKPVSFGKNRFIYYLPGTEIDYDFLLEVSQEHRPPLYRTLYTLREQGGIMSYFDVLKIASPVLDNSNNHKETLEKIIGELKSLNLADTVEDDWGGKYIVLNDRADFTFQQTIYSLRSQLSTDAMLIPDILRMLQATNIIDNQNVTYRNKNTPTLGVNHLNHVWDAVAYTKTTGYNPLLAAKADIVDKQTLVVIDVLLYRDYTMEDFQGFFDRVQSVRQSVKMGKRKILPVIIYRETDVHTFNTIRKVGFLAFNIGYIYGNRIYDVIANLNKLKASDFEDSQIDFGKIVADTLSIVKDAGQEVNFQNMKGDLFEFLLFPLLRSIFPNGMIQHSVKLKGLNGMVVENYEYDFVINLDNKEIVVIELKGFASDSTVLVGDVDTKNTLSWFFGRTLPFAKTQYKKQMGNPKVTGVYITSAKYDQAGIDYLAGLSKGKLKSSKLNMGYNGKQLIELAKQEGLQHVIDTLKKYFIQ